jgi:hypothetical protein
MDDVGRWESSTGRALSLERLGILLGSTLTVQQPGGGPRPVERTV